MGNKLSIFQYHSDLGIQQYKIALQIGVYSNPHRRNRFAKVLGSTTYRCRWKCRFSSKF